MLTWGARLHSQKRIQRDACAPQYSITFDDVTKDASTLTVSSASGNCDAGVMIASSAVTGANPDPRVSCPLFLLHPHNLLYSNPGWTTAQCPPSEPPATYCCVLCDLHACGCAPCCLLDATQAAGCSR